MGPLNKLAQSWSTLKPREQKVILAGIGIICLAAVYLLFSQLRQTTSSLREQQQMLEGELTWMHEQAELDSRLGRACENTPVSSFSSRAEGTDALTSLARAEQITVVAIDRLNNRNFRLRVNSANGNNILRFAHQSACRGFEIVSFTMETMATDVNRDAAELELRYMSQDL